MGSILRFPYLRESKPIKINRSIIKPFLRWAGGKTWFIKKVDQFLPHSFNKYYEPFLGGAAMFFHLKQYGKLNGHVILSDLNRELIECFVEVRDRVEDIIQHLTTYRNEKEFYYTIRAFSPSSAVEKAARFIYLNRTSFNGIYRVNLNGVYNVPYGFKPYNVLFDYDNLRNASLLLQGAQIISQDFQSSLKSVKEGDLVFLDPPYTVAHDNNGFIKYNQKIFAWEDQHRLVETIKDIVKKGAYFILTNAAHPSIDEIFTPCGTKTELKRFSVIGGKQAKRELKGEYVFSNLNHDRGESIL
ncbi:MAG: Dam family site-specific DNA-(adenine-N6)-methyltransferase [Deltaproteobacteria bacterium]|nr:MAG: Dam family site-specific DNA-(adenine-N6)-methyltransferase [Deltaproteobacteria bacterium]